MEWTGIVTTLAELAKLLDNQQRCAINTVVPIRKQEDVDELEALLASTVNDGRPPCKASMVRPVKDTAKATRGREVVTIPIEV